MRKYILKDLTDRKVGFIKVLSKNENSGGTVDSTLWNCICEACDSLIILNHKTITSKKKTTCGCKLRTLKFKSGNRFGKLTIVSEAEKSKNGVRQLLCQCDCGKETTVRANNLTSGNTTSCGCVGEESRRTHGMSNTRVYQIHEGMLRRCREDLKEQFPFHAGKGVKVCKEWNPQLGGSFENFYRDMGDPPEGHSLDRIDGQKDYSKNNCRWATPSVQGYNKNLDPNNTSGKSGVSFYKQNNKWSSEIHVEGEHIRLGMFNDFEEAVKARKSAELKYYGWNKQ